MPRGRPLPPLVLSPSERQTLTRWVARRKTAQALAQRARLILACAQGYSNNDVSAQVGLGSRGKWRRRFLDKRLDGLLDEPRLGAPRKITDADVERVVTLTLETTPADATHWSTRSMARRSGLSQSAVSRITIRKIGADALTIRRLRNPRKTACRHPALGQHETQLTLCTHRREHVDAETGAGAGYKRRVTAPPPGGAAMEIRTHPRLIGEEYLGSQTLRAAARSLRGRDTHISDRKR